MIANFELIRLSKFVKLHIWDSGRLVDIFNNYDGPTYVNINYVDAINFN